MTANRSGICKVPNCNKLQVRDGFCKQCGDYYLQKSILTKLNSISIDLADVTQPQPQIVQQSTDNQLLVDILSRQTQLLENVVSGLKELKTSVDNNPSTTQIISNSSEERTRDGIKKNNFDDKDDVFIPSHDSININDSATIVEKNNEQCDINKDLSSIANRLRNFDI